MDNWLDSNFFKRNNKIHKIYANLRRWRRDERGRALARVLVVVGQAQSALPAGVGPADVEAGVGEPVAVLVERAVVVLQALDLQAAALVGVALEEAAGRAHALANVVPGHADGAGAAGELAAGGAAPLAALVGLANLEKEEKSEYFLI